MGGKRFGARCLGTLIVGVAVMAACTDPSTSPSIASKVSEPKLVVFPGALGDLVDTQDRAGQMKICKSSRSNVSGTFTVSKFSGTASFLPSPTVAPNTCQIVALAVNLNETDALFDVTENAAADPANTVQTFGGASAALINGHHRINGALEFGTVLVYTNIFTAPPVELVPLFVIGNVEAHALGDKVYFSGAQWWKSNVMSGFVSNGVASFKGYASKSSPCTWVSLPGNSSNPPATIPDVVRVMVTSTISKQGPNISGNIVQYVDVKHDGNYEDNPGHAGRGEVVNVVPCSVSD